MITRLNSPILSNSSYLRFSRFSWNFWYRWRLFSWNVLKLYIGRICKNPGIHPSDNFCDFPSKIIFEKWRFRLKNESFETSRNLAGVWTYIEISPKTLHLNRILCDGYVLDIKSRRFFIFESALKISRPLKWNYHLILFTILVFDES